MTAATLKPCGVCRRRIAVRRIGAVDLLICPFCDRRKCATCGRPDTTGRARRCTGCGDTLERQ